MAEGNGTQKVLSGRCEPDPLVHEAFARQDAGLLQELGGWKSESMVRRYAHMSVKHLAPYADQLVFEDKADRTNPLGSGPGLRHKNTPSGGSSGLQLLVNNQRK